MDIPDATIWGGLTAACAAAFHYLKRETTDCKRDRKLLHEKIVTLTGVIGHLCGKLDLEVDFTKTPTIKTMEDNSHGFRQARKIAKHLGADTSEIRVRDRQPTQFTNIKELDALGET